MKWRCPHCGEAWGYLGAVLGAGHRHACPELTLERTSACWGPPPIPVPPDVLPPIPPGGELSPAMLAQMMAKAEAQLQAAVRTEFFGITPHPDFWSSSKPAAPLPPEVFCPPITNGQVLAYQRELALLAGGGKLRTGENFLHGTRGYALLYLAWEGLAEKRQIDGGPLSIDDYLVFTLTPAGEAARAALLAVGTPRNAI